MNFFELKKQAEKDGMDVKTNTKKADIEAFYASKEQVKEPKKETKPVETDTCRICGMKLYHKMCMKHGRMV